MSDQSTSHAGCRCGCRDRAGAPPAAQPIGEGYVPEPATTVAGTDPQAVHAAVASVLGSPGADDAAREGAREQEGIVPGRKPGNELGLRDVSARAAGGCDCGGHGHGGRHGGHGHGVPAEGAGERRGCGCGGH